MRILRFVIPAAVLTGFAAAAVWSARAAWADHYARRETIEGIRAAAHWMPANEEYDYRLALLTLDQQQTTAAAALRRAVAKNPADARAWIALGLDREDAGDFGEAERALLRAAQEDRQYLPRWTLANYYFRRGDREHFRMWAKAAAEMVYGDGFALFRLCRLVSEGTNLIDELEIGRPELRAAYVQYLLQDGRMDEVMPAVRRLIADGREADWPLLAAATSRLLESGRGREALEVWNALARRGSFGALAPGRGAIVTNGRFAVPPTGNGFDWRLTAVEGVSASKEDASGGLRLTFSGEQPENCDLLSEFVPVEENREYTLRFRYRTDGIRPRTGLTWRVLDGSGAHELAASGYLSAEDEQQSEVRFRTPGECRLGRLVLAYRRSAGTTRINGYAVLREVEIRPAAQLASEEPARSRVR